MNSEDIPHLAKLIFPAIIIFGAILNGVLALILYNKAKNKYDNYLKTEGTVSGIIKEKGSEGGDIIIPMVKFKVSKNEYEFKSKHGRSSWKIKEGDIVPVIYDRNNPIEAEIENRIMQYAFPLIFTAGCILALISAPIAYFTIK